MVHSYLKNVLKQKRYVDNYISFRAPWNFSCVIIYFHVDRHIIRASPCKTVIACSSSESSDILTAFLCMRLRLPSFSIFLNSSRPWSWAGDIASSSSQRPYWNPWLISIVLAIMQGIKISYDHIDPKQKKLLIAISINMYFVSRCLSATCHEPVQCQQN